MVRTNRRQQDGLETARGSGDGGKLTARLRWEIERWERIKPETQRTLLARARKGHVHPVLADKPRLTDEERTQYALFSELDRDGFSGRVVRSSMADVLDEEGVTDWFERRRRIAIWREMDRQIRRSSDKMREERKKAEEQERLDDTKPGHDERVHRARQVLRARRGF